MKYISILLLLINGLAYLACAQQEDSSANVSEVPPEGMTIATRFQPPTSFQRLPAAEHSFAHYLRHLPLYASSRKVRLYNGELKANQSAQAAVIKMDVGTRDLQQCADAVMRLRAEHLWQEKTYDKIQFNFTNGFPANYGQWRNGKRISVKGNEVKWVSGSGRDTSYTAFRKYLIQVFNYAGTHSLSKELKKTSFDDLQIGDVFIQGGFPGHAVIVVDKAINAENGAFAFLLAQSYMPAQDIHVLENPNDNNAWYLSGELEGELNTPEWTFELNDLKRF